MHRLIRFARLQQRLTQQELADRVGVVQPSVVGWESGRRASSEETVSKAARALGFENVEAFLCQIVPEWLKATGKGSNDGSTERRTTP